MTKQNIIRVDQIFKQSWAVYKNQFSKFLIIPIVMMILLAITGYINSHFIFNAIEKTGSIFTALTSFSQPAIYILIISAILTVVIQFIGLISLVIVSLKNTGVISFANVIRRSFYYFWKFIGFSIIITLINILIIFIAYIPTILLGIIIYFVYSNNFDVTFGLLGIIPAVATIVYIFYFIFTPFLIAEDKGIVQSLKESKSLIKGRWLNIFWRIVVIYIITLILGYVLSLIPYVGIVLAVLIFLPLTIIYTFVIYHNLKTNQVPLSQKTKK